jgi:glutamate racemase
VLREIRRLSPHEDILYLADTARQPYGPRTSEEVRTFAVELTRYLARQGAKMVIIACNTASAAGWEAAQRAVPDVPVLGMIRPGVRAALDASRGKRLGVWGTAITVNSRLYDQLIKQENPGVEVLGVAPTILLRLAEKGHTHDKPHLRELARTFFAPLADFQADTLILGCTDLTCVRDVIDEVVGDEVIVVDPAEEVAREARQHLDAGGMLKPRTDAPASYRFLVTGDNLDEFAGFSARFLDMPEIAVTWLSLPELQQAAEDPTPQTNPT